MLQTSIPTPAWRKTAILNTALTVLLFSALATCLIISTLRAGSINTVFVLYEEPCDGSKWLNLSLHLLLNILSTAILASSNYFKQVLVAPTRTEIDKAHNSGSWLNIGVPSSTNWISMSWSKIALWLLFVITSLPIHLFFNGIIFTTHRGDVVASNSTDMLGSENFAATGTGTCSVASSSVLLLIATACVCLKAILCVTSLQALRDPDPLITLGDAIESFLVSPDPNSENMDDILEFDCEKRPNDAKSVATAKPTTRGTEMMLGDPLCCGVYAFLVTLIMYMVTSLPRVGTRRARRLRFGNVLERFSESTRRNPPILSPDNSSMFSTDHIGLVAWRSQRLRRGQSVGTRSWNIILGSFFVVEGALLFGCWYHFPSAEPIEGLYYIYRNPTTRGPPTSLLVLVNTPQLLLSIIYLLYNSTLTKSASAIEWARFSTEYQPLRVTTPHGDQTSSYFLGLPYRYAIPIMVISALVHWVTSQALFVVTVDGTDGVVTRIASSYWAIITLAVIIPIIFAWLIWFLRRPLPGYMPLVGSNSMAISACCRLLPRSTLGSAPASDYRGTQGSSSQPTASQVELSEQRAGNQPSCSHTLPPLDSSLWVGLESRQRVCQRKLKWGVGKPMTVSDLDRYQYSSGEQRWLGFRIEEDDVQAPVEQQPYVLGNFDSPRSRILDLGQKWLYS